MKCVLCKGQIEKKIDPRTGRVYWGIRSKGNNAEPLARGRCCDICNAKVIAARFSRI